MWNNNNNNNKGNKGKHETSVFCSFNAAARPTVKIESQSIAVIFSIWFPLSFLLKSEMAARTGAATLCSPAWCLVFLVFSLLFKKRTRNKLENCGFLRCYLDSCSLQDRFDSLRNHEDVGFPLRRRRQEVRLVRLQ